MRGLILAAVMVLGAGRAEAQATGGRDFMAPRLSSSVRAVECIPIVEVENVAGEQYAPSNHMPVVAQFDTVRRDDCGLWDPEQLGVRLTTGRWAVGFQIGFEANDLGTRVVMLTIDDGQLPLLDYFAPAGDGAQTWRSIAWEIEVSGGGSGVYLRPRLAQTSGTALLVLPGTRLWVRRISEP